MTKLSKTQQDLYDEIVETYGDDRFSVKTWDGVHITDRRGTAIRGSIRIDTWMRILPLLTRVDRDNIGTWYIVKGQANGE